MKKDLGMEMNLGMNWNLEMKTVLEMNTKSISTFAVEMNSMIRLEMN